jgi:DNA-binding response OmpR family regulator
LSTKKKILIVEDDEGIADVLFKVLNRSGYEAEIESDAFRLMKDLPSLPDMFLLDNKLSGIEGVSICKHLKARPLTKSVPIIFLSASPDLKEISIRAGADDFLEKPFNLKDLVSKIQSLLP